MSINKKKVVKHENSYDGGKWSRITFDDGHVIYTKNGTLQSLMIAAESVFHEFSGDPYTISTDNPVTVGVEDDEVIGVYHNSILFKKGRDFFSPKHRVIF